MSKVTDALAEADSEMALFEPEHLGLWNLRKLPLQTTTFEDVDAVINRVEKRLALLTAFKFAAQALLDDGHPGLPKREIDSSELADLNRQIEFEQDAMTMFTTTTASAIGLAAGRVEPKR